MGYVIAAILVLLLVAGFVTFFVINATRRSGGAGPQDPGDEGTPAGIASPDETAVGTTSQHSGATGEEGRSEGADGAQKPRVGDPGPEATATEPQQTVNRPR